MQKIHVNLIIFVQANFGASLHTLKVEIGGDAQSTGITNLYMKAKRKLFK